jgi:hypothetical protein
MITNKELFKLSCAIAEENISFHTNVETDTQWALIKIGDENILAFPYTVTKLDWLQNLDFLKIPYKGMKQKWFAHRGFLNKYKSVRDEIIIAITGLDNLVITGFSQGGALATIALEDIKYNNIVSCVYAHTFGAPKAVGWFAPKKRWAYLARYTINGDPVPMLPPFIFGYKHVGNTIKLGKKRIIPKIKYHTESYNELL